MKLLIGADPEVFAYDKTRGQFISAHGLIPGTKAEPYKVNDGAVQVDGMALEFNIVPDSNIETVWQRIVHVRKTMEAMLPANIETKAEPSVTFVSEVFDQAPPHAKELGCEPDFSAYTFSHNVIDTSAKNSRHRTASGHIHLGWTSGVNPLSPEHIVKCGQMVQQLDSVVGAICVLIEGTGGRRRRKLYGALGAFRPKPYGLEYRTPANNWIRDEKRAALVLEATVVAFRALAEDKTFLPKMMRDVRKYQSGWVLGEADKRLGTSFLNRTQEIIRGHG